MGFIKEISSFAANLEKDLAERFDEFTELINLGYASLQETLDICLDNWTEKIGDVTIDNFFDELREKLLLFKRVLPTMMILAYDSLIRFILFEKTIWGEEDQQLAKEQGLLTKIPAESLYNFYLRFNSDAAYIIFRNLDCPTRDIEVLRNSLLDRNKELFIETLNKIDADKSVLYYFAGLLGTMYELVLNMYMDPQSIYNYIYCTNGGIPIIIRDSNPALKQVLASFLKIKEKDKNESVPVYSKEELYRQFHEETQKIDNYILKALSSIKGIIIDLEQDSELFPFEKNYIDTFYNEPELQPYFERLQGSVENPALTIEQPETSKEESSIAPESVGSFALPSHFFKLSIDLSNSDEFLVVKHEVEKGGTKLFASLIDYIASQGYIDNNDRTKRLLVYTLTGRWRPDDYQSGETIIWKDNGNEGKELCYIIKSIIASNKKEHKYDKMHKFFTGPNWSKTVPDKDQGNNASKNFKKALHDRYPTICKL